MNLLVFNLAMDADDPVLGHTTAWVNALAMRCERVSVVTMRTGRLAVEPNVVVHSLGRERGLSEPRRLARFYRLVGSVLREHPVDACFAHMAPLFAVLFAPLAKLNRIPILLWYAHSSVTRTLRLAHGVADRCVTATDDSFLLPSEKLFVIGHGIDVGRFRPVAEPAPLYHSTVISVGRVAPIKHIDEMIEAVGMVGDEHGARLRLRLFGTPLTVDDDHYQVWLRQLVGARGLADRVSFEGAIPYGTIPAAYHSGALFLNLSETGAIDKAILESMASGCIPVSSNASYAALAREHGLDRLVPERGAASVAERIAAVLDQSAEQRARTAERLRQIVVERHGLDRLADSLIGHLRELAAQPAQARSGRASA